MLLLGLVSRYMHVVASHMSDFVPYIRQTSDSSHRVHFPLGCCAIKGHFNARVGQQDKIKKSAG